MGEKQPINVPIWRGINETHTRDISQPSSGKNFYTERGALKTRPGLVEVTGTPLNSKIRSMFASKVAQMDERFIVETNNGVYTLTAHDGWFLRSNKPGNNYGFMYSVWRDTVIMAGGNTMVAYNLEADSYWENFTYGSESGAKGEGTAVYKDRVFLFGPHFAPANALKFCGYSYLPPELDDNGDPIEDAEPEIDDIDISVWPEKFNIRLNDGGAILGAVVQGSNMFCLTSAGYWHLYGNSEDDFEIIRSGSVGAYDLHCVQMVNDITIWLGDDKRVYIYTGSAAETISQPIDDMLSKAFTGRSGYIKTYSIHNQFWIVFNYVSTSKVFVFDVIEKEWFVYEFSVVITAACIYQEEIHLGTSNGKLYKFTPGTNDAGIPITTELTLGPIDLESIKFKLKRIWVNAEPKRDFSFNVYAKCDDGQEVLQGNVEFKNGIISDEFVKFSSVKGRNISVRLVTTDLVDELQSAMFVVVPKGIK